MINDLQRIQVKIASNAPDDLNLDPIIAIFARWRHEKDDPAQWVDLADYAHMRRGPGVMLSGMRANIAFDMGAPRPGFLYTARKGLSGSYQDRIGSVLRSCFSFALRIAREKEFPSGVVFDWTALEFRFPDRLETPNNSTIDRELRPALTQLLDTLFGRQAYELKPQPDPGEAYGFFVKAEKEEVPEILLDRIAGALHR